MIGGGILGGCLAWDAALRGTQGGPGRAWGARRGHLGQQPSDHPGRPAYLVLGDLRRMRESIRERSVLLRIAPGLVRPPPVAIPSGIRGYPNRTRLRLGLALNDILSAGRNRHLVSSRHLPARRTLSAGELAALSTGLGPLTQRGGALWFDALMSRPEHLIRAFVRSATERGGPVVNTACAERFTSSGGRVLSVAIRDCQAGASRWSWPDISSWLRARGPGGGGGWEGVAPRAPRHALGLSLVVRRRLADAAISLRSERSATERIRR